MSKVAAHKESKTPHEKLREPGADGIPGPAFYKYETGELNGTRRLHDTTITQAELEDMGVGDGAQADSRRFRYREKYPALVVALNVYLLVTTKRKYRRRQRGNFVRRHDLKLSVQGDAPFDG